MYDAEAHEIVSTAPTASMKRRLARIEAVLTLFQ